MVEAPGMFGPRREAMVALGRLGQAVGPERAERAAAVIRAEIYDSSPEVARARVLALARLEDATAIWARCTACCYGQVQRAGSFGIAPCAECGGIGWVRSP
jgi:hypothetical protein